MPVKDMINRSKLFITLFKVGAVVISALLLVVIGYFSYEKSQRNNMAKAVRDHKIIIDQEAHNWLLSGEPALRIELYVRNSSECLIKGTLVFSSSLKHKWLEKRYLESLVDVFTGREGEEILKEALLSPERQTPKAKAILAYLSRGKKLEPGLMFEPLKDQKNVPDYTFTFREKVLLKPGEVTKIVKEPQIPPDEGGYLLEVAIDKIEFK